MAVNKVVFGAVAIMDISDSTVTPETLAEGVTAYDKTGKKITGTMTSGGSTETTQYLHIITFDNDNGETLTMTLVNNSSASLSGEYETEDTDIYNGAIIQGYEGNGAVIGHYSNGGGGMCYLELADGTQVNSFYGSYTDTVAKISGDDSGSSDNTQLSVIIDGTSYPITAGMTWGEFIADKSEFGTDYSGGVGWSLMLDCWNCNSSFDKYVDPVVYGSNGAIFGTDGTVAMPQIVINPYCTYFTQGDMPSNCIFNSIT